MAFVKIHGEILDSSVWSLPHPTRIVWVTMLAMANEHGIVAASVDGLARRAVVTIAECETALAVFLGPDPHSRDGTSGERIEKVPGGWLVLNHGEYRDRQTHAQVLTAERVRRHREKIATRNAAGVTEGGVTPHLPTSPSEAEAEAEAEADPGPTLSSPPAPEKPASKHADLYAQPNFAAFWAIHPRGVGKLAAAKAWRKVPADLHDRIIADVARRLDAGGDWRAKLDRNEGDFIPHAATYLNGRRWEDSTTAGAGRGPSTAMAPAMKALLDKKLRRGNGLQVAPEPARLIGGGA